MCDIVTTSIKSSLFWGEYWLILCSHPWRLSADWLRSWHCTKGTLQLGTSSSAARSCREGSRCCVLRFHRRFGSAGFMSFRLWSWSRFRCAILATFEGQSTGWASRPCQSSAFRWGRQWRSKFNFTVRLWFWRWGFWSDLPWYRLIPP